MLTLPKLVARKARPYVAVRRKVKIPFGKAIPKAMGELFREIERLGLKPTGPVFFKYNVVMMPELEMEFGVPVAKAPKDAGTLVSGVFPAGKYAEVNYFGHYKNLQELNAVLIGWAAHKGIAWDSEQKPDGEHFAARFEVYPNSPEEEPDPEKWETLLSIKTRD